MARSFAQAEEEDDSSDCCSLTSSPPPSDGLYLEPASPAPSMDTGSASSGVTFAAQALTSEGDEPISNLDKTLEVSDPPDFCWTDDKHSSYLSFMEATFVKNLYDREYCVPDLCGQAPHCEEGVDEADSAESQLCVSSPRTEFKSYQNGDWNPRQISKPLMPSGFPWGLLANPWVKHFRHQPCYAGTGSNRHTAGSSFLKEREEGSFSRSPGKAIDVEPTAGAQQRYPLAPSNDSALEWNLEGSPIARRDVFGGSRTEGLSGGDKI